MATKARKAPTKRRISEAELQAAIVEYAQRSGWLVNWIPDWMFSLAVKSMARGRRGDRQWSPPGFPDLVLMQGLRDQREPVRLIFVELKSEKGVFREPQQDWLLALIRVPGIEVYAWRPEDWTSGTVERVLQNGPMPDHPGTQKEVDRAKRQRAKREGLVS